jgi:CRISPR-associated protein Csb1
VLAALALIAFAEQDRAGYALRSRCDLVCDGKSPFKVVHPDGSTDDLEFDLETAVDVFKESVAKAKMAGFPWRDEPLKLVPQRRLVELVALSRAKALAGDPEGENA